jgi:hypothetical protein
MIEQKQNDLAEELSLMNEIQELDEWSDARIAKLVDFEDYPKTSPEIAPEVAPDEFGMQETNLTSEQNTVSQAELFDDPIKEKTKPTFSSRGVSKIGGVGLPLLIVFVGGGLFLTAVMGSKPRQAATVASKPVPVATSKPTPTSETEEIGNMKTQLAVGSQERQIKDLEKSKSPKTNVTKTQQPQSVSGSHTAVPPQSTSSLPRTQPVSYRQPYTPAPSAPRAVSSYQVAVKGSTPPASLPASNTFKRNLVSSPSPVREQLVSSPSPSAQIQPSPLSQQKTPIDPMQQWIALSQIGSYGTGDVGEKALSDEANSSRTDLARALSNQAQMIDATSGVVTIPRAIPVRSATSGVLVASASGGVPFPSAVTDTDTGANGESSEISLPVPSPSTVIGVPSPQETSQVSQPDAIALSSPASIPSPVELAAAIVKPSDSESIRIAEEANILSGVPLRSLQVGAIAQGQLVTPLNWAGNRASAVTKSTSQNSVGEKFIVQLAQPLTDKDGFVALPAGTQIVAQVADVNESGLVQLSVTQAVVDGQEYVLPPGAISIRGNDGQPLIASMWGNKRPVVSSSDKLLRSLIV